MTIILVSLIFSFIEIILLVIVISGIKRDKRMLNTAARLIGSATAIRMPDSDKIPAEKLKQWDELAARWLEDYAFCRRRR